jgi:hypothetical protein
MLRLDAFVRATAVPRAAGAVWALFAAISCIRRNDVRTT